MSKTYFKRSYFWLVYIRRRLCRLFTEIFPYSRPESFSSFFLRGTFTTHSSQGGKIWVFPSAGGMFIFAVKLYNETFTRAFYRDLSYFLIKLPFFLFLFSFIHFIALSRVYFTFGGLGGPKKDRILRLVDELVSLGSFSSDSSH